MARSPYLRLRIDATPGTRPSRADIVAAVHREFESGRLPKGSRVPPVRMLQHQLGIAKNTVHAAYDELVAQGVLINRNRQGYFVLERASKRGAPLPTAPAQTALLKVSARNAVTTRARDPIRLSSAFIDGKLLPRERIAQCSSKASPSITILKGTRRFARSLRND